MLDFSSAIFLMTKAFVCTKKFGFGFIALSILATWAANHYLILAYPAFAFIATIVVIVVALIVTGLGLINEFDGVLIDNRNRISLSKFQITMWTVLVVAALIVIASHNLELNCSVAPLDFRIPPELLGALGISAASFVSTPIVLSYKADQTPQPGEKAKAEQELNTNNVTGKLIGHDTPAQANWTDMLVGEEVGNVGYPDLGKIQQLFISLLVVAIYAFAVYRQLLRPIPIEGLPPLGENFVWLMGVSHASYLAYKAVPHSKSA